MLVEAAWAVARAPGPLHAFFVRIQPGADIRSPPSRYARKLAVLLARPDQRPGLPCGPRPALVANKTRAIELQAGKPKKKGNRPGPAYAYNVKALRDQEQQLAQQAERNYARFVDRWRTHPPKDGARERLNPARNE